MDHHTIDTNWTYLLWENRKKNITLGAGILAMFSWQITLALQGTLAHVVILYVKVDFMA